MKRSQWFLRTALIGALAVGGSSLAMAAAPTAPVHTTMVKATQTAPATTLLITGSATKVLAPTYATISLGVTTEADTVQNVKAKNDAIMKQVLAKVKALGVTSKDISTQIDVNPIVDYQKTPHKTTGYRMSNTVTIRVNQLEQAGRVIDAALAAGATQLNSIAYAAELTQSAKDELIQDAIANATHTAHIVAQSVGKKVIGIEEISVGNGNNAPVIQPKLRSAVAFAASDSTPIEFGTVQAHQSVTLQFTLQ